MINTPVAVTELPHLARSLPTVGKQHGEVSSRFDVLCFHRVPPVPPVPSFLSFVQIPQLLRYPTFALGMPGMQHLKRESETM